VVQIALPALRERSDDLELLARHFVQRFSREYSKRVTGMSPEVIRVLKLWQFPGNVRELQNVVERAVALCAGPLIILDDLPPRMREPQSPTTEEVESFEFPEDGVNLDSLLAVLEKRWLVAALDATQGNKTRASSMLQMSFRSFRYRLAKYDLDHEA
jgi:two-component system response regulator PilR (NtrC family)